MKRADLQIGFLLRMFLLASIAVVASVYALARYYGRKAHPVASPPAAQSADAGERIIEAPEIEVEGK